MGMNRGKREKSLVELEGKTGYKFADTKLKLSD